MSLSLLNQMFFILLILWFNLLFLLQMWLVASVLVLPLEIHNNIFFLNGDFF